MKKEFLLLIFLSFTFCLQAQVKRPAKIPRTSTNKANDCMIPIFELEDAADFCDTLRVTTDIKNIKRLLDKVKSSWDDFELYSEDCYCMKKLEDEIFLFSPEDDIEKALTSNNSIEIQKLIKSICYDIDFLWLLASDCD